MVTKSVDVLIITALPEEFEALRLVFALDQKIQSETCQLTYHIGPLQTEKEGVFYFCAATCLHDMGNTGSGVGATCAIQDLSPSYVIMFGLAAGIESEVKLGDVIVPTHISYYELAKLKPEDVEVRPSSYQSDLLLRSRLADFASSYRGTHKVKFGPFAAGEKVVADTKAVEKLKQADPKLLGIEMESYGVARAAAGRLYRPRFIAIRGVSDYADENKSDNSRELALANAGNFFVSFLKTGALPKDKPKPTDSEVNGSFIAIHHLSLNKRASIKATSQKELLEYVGLEFKEISIDQTDLYNNGVFVNPQVALQRQNDLIKQLNDFIDIYPSSHVGYFGLAHIPLMFYVGYQVNRQMVDVFATNRQTGCWIPLKKSGRGSKLRLEKTIKKSSLESGDVIIRVSISYSVREDQIEGIVKQPLASFHLRLDEPRTDVVTSEAQLDSYTRMFHELLVDINAHFPNRKRVHLFMSVPPTVAFRFGQQVSKTIDPEILAYNYSNKDHPAYGWAVNIGTGEVIDFRNV